MHNDSSGFVFHIKHQVLVSFASATNFSSCHLVMYRSHRCWTCVDILELHLLLTAIQSGSVTPTTEHACI